MLRIAVLAIAALAAAGPASAADGSGRTISEADFSVQARQGCTDTGIVIAGGQRVAIRYLGGRWTANPASGLYGPEGLRTRIAKPGYALPGGSEGALVARVGGTTTAGFDGPQEKLLPDALRGKLELCINDDTRAMYGVGLADNIGQLDVRVRLYQPQ